MQQPATHAETPEPGEQTPTGGGAGNDLKPATLAFLILLIGIGLSATVTAWHPPSGSSATEQHLDLVGPPWWATRTELQVLAETRSARRRGEATLQRESKAVVALERAYRDYNIADLAAGGRRDSTRLQDAHADYKARAVDVFRFQGSEAFLALGQILLDEFWTALAQQDAAKVNALTGAFVPEAQTIGLMRSPFEPAPHARPVIGAAFILRWVVILSDERPVEGMIAPVERRLLMRFKVGAHRALTPQRRIEHARTLRKLQPDYPSDELIAARFVAEGRWKRAARFYRRALKYARDDLRLKANLAFCEGRAALASTTSSTP